MARVELRMASRFDEKVGVQLLARVHKSGRIGNPNGLNLKMFESVSIWLNVFEDD